MHKRETGTSASVKPRMIGRSELPIYTGLGITSAVKFAREAGAERKYGRRSLFDVRILDEAIDNLSK